MNQKTLTELKLREELLYYMQGAHAAAINVYLDLNRKLECGIGLPPETLFSIACDNLFNSIDEKTLLFDEKTKTELLLSRVIVDENPYKTQFVYTIEQRDINGYLLSSEDFEIGEEDKVLEQLKELGVMNGDF